MFDQPSVWLQFLWEFMTIPADGKNVYDASYIHIYKFPEVIVEL